MYPCPVPASLQRDDCGQSEPECSCHLAFFGAGLRVGGEQKGAGGVCFSSEHIGIEVALEVAGALVPAQLGQGPQGEPGAVQGWLALDGSALGPLFNDHDSDTSSPAPPA